MRPLFALLIVSASMFAQAGNFVAPSAGYCWTAHCSNYSDGNATALSIPSVPVAVSIDANAPPNLEGLGCVTNGSWTACRLKNTTGPNLVVYNAALGRICSNLTAIPPWSELVSDDVNIPAIAVDGSVLFSDLNFVRRVDPHCNVVWPAAASNQSYQGLKLTPNGDYLVTNGNGALQEYNASTGALVGSATWVSTCSTPPCSAGSSASFYRSLGNDIAMVPASQIPGGGSSGTLSRIYYVGQLTTCSPYPTCTPSANPSNRLFAIDVKSTGLYIESWSGLFWGPSGSTPDWNGGTIYEDMCTNGVGSNCPTQGGNPGPGTIGFVDNWPASGNVGLAPSFCSAGSAVTVPSSGGAGSVVCGVSAYPAVINAFMSWVPSGCYLVSYLSGSKLDCRNPTNGSTSGGVAFSLPLTGIIPNIPGASGIAWNVLGEKTITTDGSGHYIAIMTLFSTSQLSYVAAIRLDTHTLLWAWPNIGQTGSTPNEPDGQFPLSVGANGNQVCFTSKVTGPQCLARAASSQGSINTKGSATIKP